MPTGQINISPFYSEILQRLDAVRRKEHRLSLLYGLLATLLLAFLLLFFVIVIEQISSPGVIVRTVLFFITLLPVLALTVWIVLRPLLRLAGILKSESTLALATKVGNHFPSIHDRLLDALQIYEQRDNLKQLFSIDLIDASFSDLYRQIQPLNFTEAVSNSRIRKTGKFVSYAVGIILLTLVVSPSGFFNSLYRIVHYQQTFAATLPVQFIVDPGNKEVVRGENIPIKIRTEGKPLQSISLMMRPEGQLEFDAQVLKSQNGVFQTEVNNIKSSTEYYAAAEDVTSEKFKISVLDRPFVRSMRLKLTPPFYTHFPSKMLDENAGDVQAYPGTRITAELSASKELATAMLVFNDSTKLPFTVTSTTAGCAFTVKNEKTYHVLLTDLSGLHNPDPVEYSITVLNDEYPTAEILSPAHNVDITEDMKLDIFVRIKDDFGFTKLRLAHRLIQSRYEQPREEFSYIDIPLPAGNQNLVELWYHWDLSSLHLVPEDALAYFAEVFDNDNVNGPKSGKSATYTLRVPSLEEVFSDVSQTHEQSLESMQSVSNETKELKKEIENLQNDMKKNSNKMDWQQKKKAEEMVQRYEEMKKKVGEVSQKLDEMTKKLEENKALSPQTMEKYLELQKIMEQLKSPELQEALKKLQESMKQPSPEEMRQAMQRLKLSEEQFRQSLERTIELLKRIHIEQKLDELVKRAEELSKQQEALKQQSQQTNPSDQQKRNELAQQQGDLKKQLDALDKETGDLKEKMEEFSKEMPMEEMKKAQEQLQQQQLQQKMQQSAQQLQSGDMQQAQENQQQTTEGLNQFKNMIQKAQQALQDKQMKQIVRQMRKQLENMLELSKREESLKNETESLNPNSQRFREGAEEQMQTLTDLSNVANSMSELSKKTFAISPEMAKEVGNAINQMNDAMQSMEGRNPSGAGQKQSEAMGSLNRAAMMMQNALNGLMKGGKDGMGMAGLMGALQQMAGAQNGINMGTQQAMGMGKGDGQGLSPQQQAEYQRLGGQQAALQKSLEELSNEAKNTGEFSKLLGDIDQVAKEMQEVQTDLEQGNVNPNTTQKQEKILSRLLESTRSMRERDYEKRRKAESGKNIQRISPAEIDLTTQEGKNRLREEFLKVLEGKYSKDYEDLIKKYFEQLEKEEVK